MATVSPAVGVVDDVVGGGSSDMCIGESCEGCEEGGGGGAEDDEEVEGVEEEAESGRGGAGAPATAER